MNPLFNTFLIISKALKEVIAPKKMRNSCGHSTSMLAVLFLVLSTVGVFSAKAVFDDTYVSRSGLMLWLRADSLVLANGAAVSQWADQSGNGNNASQLTTANQPTYTAVTDGLNSMPSVNFKDNLKHYLSVTDTAGLNPAQVTVIAVARRSANSSNNVMVAEKGNGTKGYSLRFASATVATAYINGAQGASGAITTGTFALLDQKYDQINNSLYVNNLVPGTNAYTSPVTAYANPLTIGGRTTSNNLDGDIAELMVYNHALSDADRQAIEAYVYAKYLIGAKPVMTAPSFGIATGTYSEAKVETITASAGSTIYYTIDGSSPTTNSPVYSDPLTITATTTIKAIAIRNGYADSAVGQATITIDSTTSYIPRDGLSLWLRADLINQASDTAVGVWKDQSGSLNDAVQATTTNQPVFKSNVLNGKPIVRFSSAAKQYMTVADNVTLSSPKISMIAVFQRTAGNGTATVVEKTVAGSGSGYRLRMADAITARCYINGNSADGSVPLNTFSMVLTSYDKVNNSIYVNGSPGQASSYSSDAASVSAPLCIGGQTTNNPLDGDIAEILVYTRSLSDMDRKGIEAYVSLKYHVGISVAPTPNLSVKTGTYATAQMESLDVGAGYTIYYTLDGSTPTTSSSVYNGNPISITSSCVVTAISALSGTENSLPAQAKITIDPATAYLARNGLKLWLRADSINQANSSAISIWSDQSGNGNDATQGAVNNMPTLVVNAINTKPAVAFLSSAKQYMAVGNGGLLKGAVFAVAKRADAGSATYGILEKYIPPSWPDQSGIWKGYSLRMRTATSVTWSINSRDTDAPIQAGAYSLMEGFQDPNGQYLYVNDIQKDDNPYLNDITQIPDPLYIGGSPSRPLNGNIAEVVVYDRVPTEQERKNIEAYFRVKYNLGDGVLLPAPKFSHDSGVYPVTQTVTMSGEQGSTIYYTKDGSTPSPSSLVYSVPISVSATSTLKAYAVKAGYLDSAVTSIKLVIGDASSGDGLPASYSLDSNGNGVPDSVESALGFDPNHTGNNIGGGASTFDYDHLHRITTAPDGSYIQDAENNILHK